MTEDRRVARAEKFDIRGGDTLWAMASEDETGACWFPVAKVRDLLEAVDQPAQGQERRECEDCGAAFICEDWSEVTRCTACHFLHLKIEAELRAEAAEQQLQALQTERDNYKRWWESETAQVDEAWQALADTPFGNPQDDSLAGAIRSLRASLAQVGAAPRCVCQIEDGLVQEWVSKARAVAKSKGYSLAQPGAAGQE